MKEESGGVGLRLCRRRTAVLRNMFKERLMGGNSSSLLAFMAGVSGRRSSATLQPESMVVLDG
jgi:hypothetical protein